MFINFITEMFAYAGIIRHYVAMYGINEGIPLYM